MQVIYEVLINDTYGCISISDEAQEALYPGDEDSRCLDMLMDNWHDRTDASIVALYKQLGNDRFDGDNTRTKLCTIYSEASVEETLKWYRFQISECNDTEYIDWIDLDPRINMISKVLKCDLDDRSKIAQIDTIMLLQKPKLQIKKYKNT